MRTKITLSILLFSVVTTLQAQSPADLPFRDPTLSIDQRVDDLVSRLTTEEKLSQMSNATPAIERLDIPEYDWWNEALHGVARSGRATVFPQAIALAATFDDEALFESFTMISDEGRAKYNNAQANSNYKRYYGLTFWTPNINIFRDPRWGRGQETYGEDPYLTSRMGVAAVKGLQGDDPNYLKSHACAKHYAVHSGPEWNRHSYDATATPYDLWETYLPAFEALVKEGNVQEVMGAYNRFQGDPCCASNFLLKDILRDKWGYKGLVVSDCGAIADFFQEGHHETHASAVEAVVAAIESGTDLECGKTYQLLMAAINEGRVDEKVLEVSLKRIFKGRFELGMFDPQELVPYSDIPMSVVCSDEHSAQALEMAQKSIVLLKNSKSTLPLSKDVKSVAVVGPNADDQRMLWGNYNGQPKSTTTILNGIKSAIPNATVTYIKGSSHTEAEMSPEDVAAQVKDSEVVIFVGGISPQLEGEEMKVDIDGFRGGDRDNIEIPAAQREMYRAIEATGVPVVYLSCSGSALALTEEADSADALLQIWYGGQAAGDAVADVLFGDYNPSGRLPVTFYRSADDIPDFEDYAMEGRTYRYFRGTPLYPFGYGLSYTKFKYGGGKLSKGTISQTEDVTLEFDLSNSGKMAGDEVVQVYIKRIGDSAIKTLKYFKRYTLSPSEKQHISITLPNSSFETFDEISSQMQVQRGEYVVMYGSSSADGDLREVKLTIN